MKTINPYCKIIPTFVFAVTLAAFTPQACQADSVEVIMQGKISLLNLTDGALDISGVNIALTNAAVMDETGAVIQQAELKVGDRVTINATSTAQGRLTAVQIRKTLRDNDALQGRNERTDAAARAFTIAGITVKAPLNARIEDAEARAVPLEQCPTNSVLACSGSWTGPCEFTATSVALR